MGIVLECGRTDGVSEHPFEGTKHNQSTSNHFKFSCIYRNYFHLDFHFFKKGLIVFKKRKGIH